MLDSTTFLWWSLSLQSVAWLFFFFYLENVISHHRKVFNQSQDRWSWSKKAHWTLNHCLYVLYEPCSSSGCFKFKTFNLYTLSYWIHAWRPETFKCGSDLFFTVWLWMTGCSNFHAVRQTETSYVVKVGNCSVTLEEWNTQTLGKVCAARMLLWYQVKIYQVF